MPKKQSRPKKIDKTLMPIIGNVRRPLFLAVGKELEKRKITHTEMLEWCFTLFLCKTDIKAAEKLGLKLP